MALCDDYKTIEFLDFTFPKGSTKEGHADIKNSIPNSWKGPPLVANLVRKFQLRQKEKNIISFSIQEILGYLVMLLDDSEIQV